MVYSGKLEFPKTQRCATNKERSVLEFYSLTFGTPLKSGISGSGFTKCRFCFRKWFVFRDLDGRCVPPHAERFEPNTVLWAIPTIQPSSLRK